MKDYPNTFVCLFLHNVYINPLIMNELYFFVNLIVLADGLFSTFMLIPF